jgi:hypothetical protein
MRTDWECVLGEARDIVESYDTQVTLRQLFYRLVAAQLLDNTLGAYKGLSRVTAQARRDGEFPRLIDRTRSIHRPLRWTSPQAAIRAVAASYRRDRTEGQNEAVYLGVEKAGMVVQLQSWFSDLGIPVLSLGGYASQSYAEDTIANVAADGRPAVLIYAGDHDPSGHDIDRDFIDRTDCFDVVIRVALLPEQVIEYQLPPMPGKEKDSRAGGFIERFGELVQVELDALPPDVLRGLFTDAIDRFWDMSASEETLDRERAEREDLTQLARSWEP